jgi:hypothetical protein
MEKILANHMFNRTLIFKIFRNSYNAIAIK